MPGFFDLSDPQTALPLLGLLQGLGNAAAPQRTPVPFGSVLGQAAQGYMGGQQAAQQQAANQLGMASTRQDMALKQLQIDQQKRWEDFLKGASASSQNTPPTPPPTAPAQNVNSGPIDNNSLFDNYYSNFLIKHEGTAYTPEDGNGHPARFGINQGANPDIDVKNLTIDKAKDITKQRYWHASGSDTITNPQLAAINMDAAFAMGPAVAKNLLAQSGGDPSKYLDLLKSRYQAIAANNPSKAMYLSNWMRRANDLGKFAGGLPNVSVAPSAAAPETGTQSPSSLFGGLDPRMLSALPADVGMQMLLKQQHTLTPEELAANHLPPNTLAQRDATGAISVVYKPQGQDILTPDEVKALGFPAGTVVGRDPMGVNHVLYKPSQYQVDMKPEELDNYARQYIMDKSVGQRLFPRDPKSRAAVANRANEILVEAGHDPSEIAAYQAAGDSGRKSLAEITSLGSKVTQFEETAQKNADVVLDVAPKGVGPSGIPVFDSWLQAGRKATGDPNVAAFNTAIRTFANEYARVMTGGTGNVPLSDAARRETDDLLNNAVNMDQLRATMAIMKRDMANRIAALNDTKAALTHSLVFSNQGLAPVKPGSPSTNTPSPAVAPPKPAAPTTLPANARMQLKEGQITIFGNGQRWTLRNGQPVQVQ